MGYTQSSGYVCGCTYQDLISRLDAGRDNGKMQGNGPICYSNPVLAAAIFGKLSLELPQRFAKGSRNFTPLECGNDRIDLILLDDGFKNRNFHLWSSTLTLSYSVPRNGPCLTLIHCISSMTRRE